MKITDENEQITTHGTVWMNLSSILVNGSQAEMNKKEYILCSYIYIKFQTRKTHLWC